MSRGCWSSAAITPAWCTSSRRWKPATPIKPWHDKQTHKTFIRPDSGKCLHYYFYFLDARFGLIYLRVPDLGAVPPAILLQWP